MRAGVLGIGLVLAAVWADVAAAAGEKPPVAPVAIALPGGERGIGFDDLAFSAALGKLLVPAGRTGRLDLIDPVSGAVTTIDGFSTVEAFTGGHDDGITSVAEGAGLLFVTDRTSQRLSLIDPGTRTILGGVALGASPDYVRWAAATHELWVSEPDSERIEVFRLEDVRPPRITAAGRIAVPEGPESLLFDAQRGRAYTHYAGGKTAVLDLHTHAIIATWQSGCSEPTGIALDAERGLLLVACEDGGLATLDVTTGEKLGSIALDSGIDIIAYEPKLGHAYVASAETATLTVIAVAPRGGLSRLGTLPATADSHCLAAAGKVYYCDPAHGRLMAVMDPYAPGRR